MRRRPPRSTRLTHSFPTRRSSDLLLRAGLFWSGLILLAPHHGDGDDAERAWKVWLARLRRFPLRGPNATPDDLDFKRVAAGRERLDFQRRMRLYSASDQIGRAHV